MNLLSSKKGGLLDNYIVIPIFLFLFGISAIMGLLLWTSMVDAFTTAGVYTGVAETTGNAFTSSLTLLDSITVILMVAILIGIGVTSYRIRVPAIYFVVMLMMGIFLGIVSYFFNFMFAQFVSNVVFDTIRVNFVKTIWICTNLHWVSLVAIIIGSILTYSKKVDYDTNPGTGGNY